jgi:uncharacterized membrane protein
MDIMHILYIVIASIFILFLPGFFITFIFFDWNKIDLIERIALSFALSIAVVPLVAFYANLAGVPINNINIVTELIIILLITCIILILKWKVFYK